MSSVRFHTQIVAISRNVATVVTTKGFSTTTLFQSTFSTISFALQSKALETFSAVGSAFCSPVLFPFDVVSSLYTAWRDSAIKETADFVFFAAIRTHSLNTFTSGSLGLTNSIVSMILVQLVLNFSHRAFTLSPCSLSRSTVLCTLARSTFSSTFSVTSVPTDPAAPAIIAVPATAPNGALAPPVTGARAIASTTPAAPRTLEVDAASLTIFASRRLRSSLSATEFISFIVSALYSIICFSSSTSSTYVSYEFTRRLSSFCRIDTEDD
ncbi:hypothetical protein GBAR_LOCUS34 [Geodia barretti]|uniref:Uncharacterized protein n=1 Tax=Geodia barretti TaxID=519541 RepID=A0AA35QRV5_GEOBA|nr:hypothetical protein GBAR_LOCUS34 [Geodia barretti]